jgi:hypothetical protein
MRRLLDARPTAGPYAAAFDKWAQAESLLWTADDTRDQLTTIGHLCREAMQHFAAAFAAETGAAVDANPANTVRNVRAGLTQLKGRLPKALTAMLDALLTYWGTIDDLVQRQEHGALKEGEPIGREDARVVVMQTAIVMHELRRAAGRAR